MRLKRTSKVDDTPVRFVLITLDPHMRAAVERARDVLAVELPMLDLRFHAATSFVDPASLEACRADIAEADIVFANMLFIDEHIRAVLPALLARRDECDAMVCAMSAPEVVKLTRMGRLSMAESEEGKSLLSKLRPKREPGKAPSNPKLGMLRRLPKLLKLIPGKAQDLRAYLLTLSYWLSGSSENLADLVRMLVGRYADGPREALRRAVKKAAPPRRYPETGVYHPQMPDRMSESAGELPRPAHTRGTVGIVLLRSYLLAGDTAHYDGVIASCEARGLRVIPIFAPGLDARPAIDAFFRPGGKVVVDAVVSLTGFSLVGGPAFSDANAAEETLAGLDVPYVAAQPLEFQTVEQWEVSGTGLTPLEATLMVAIPELDGATGPIVFGGRREGGSAMTPIGHRIEQLTARVERLVSLRRTPRHERDVAIVLFDFPPNSGATGTAAYLSVFESLQQTLRSMKAGGYDVDVPADVDELRRRVLEGNSAQFGTDANVVAQVSVDEHVRETRHLGEIERVWGPAPGKHLTDGSSLFVLGARFGRVLVAVQPAFGFEGDPMRLLFEGAFAPTHAFVAFYRYLRETFGADAVVHFGTHGALEFMPGKQVGLGESCWSDRLIGDLPNIYLYASNNPSEGALARRRAAATLVSYLTPAVTRSGLYNELRELREMLDRLRALPPGQPEEARLVAAVVEKAASLDLGATELDGIHRELVEIEDSLIPQGLHVLGESMAVAGRIETLAALGESRTGAPLPTSVVEALANGASADDVVKSTSSEHLGALQELERTNTLLCENVELDALLAALDARYIRPAPGGDLLRNPAVLPTGRNLHGFDPFGLPSAFAVQDGIRQVSQLLEAHMAQGNELPHSVALVLWGADNLKSGGAPIGQAMALMGARPRFDSYGRLCGAKLVDLEELGRPRIDVVMTLSGIFRDLLPLQTQMLAEAAWLAASADEPLESNFIRAHALAYEKEHQCGLQAAAVRVFSNAEGAYGANVSQLVDAGTWQDESELAEVFARRKSFGYRPDGSSSAQRTLLESSLGGIDLAYQNLESVELGITTIDHYFDTLGGISRLASRGGRELPVYIGDQTQSEERVRTLAEQVALESRTRSLNPKWAEEMLRHGAEGVRQLEAQVTNTLGWSATTGQVAPWVYTELTKTYVLDEVMRARLARLNPKASVRLANRLIEAAERAYWEPDAEMLEALEAAGEELEDQLEGVIPRVA